MELATLQRQLLGLIKSTYHASEHDDPYIRAVAASDHLELVREVVAWWRAYGLERSCALTSALLKQLGLFDETVHTFISGRSVSPYIEELGAAFLEEMSAHENHLVASVAQFELALMRIRAGEPSTYVIPWRREPYTVLERLVKHAPLAADLPEGLYQVRVSRDLPGLFEVEAGQADE